MFNNLPENTIQPTATVDSQQRETVNANVSATGGCLNHVIKAFFVCLFVFVLLCNT